MFQRLRRSFRRKKASYCINCGHVSKDCYHQEYENVFFGGSENGTQRADELKWLDLDYAKQHQQKNYHGMQWSAEYHHRDIIVAADDMEVLNNNAKNTFVRREHQFLNTNNLTYRNSSHIPVYNNYVTFPKSTHHKVRKKFILIGNSCSPRLNIWNRDNSVYQIVSHLKLKTTLITQFLTDV